MSAAPEIVHELLDRIWDETFVGHKRIEIGGGGAISGAYRAETNRGAAIIRIETPATRERLPAGAPEAWSRWRRFERAQQPWREIV